MFAGYFTRSATMSRPRHETNFYVPVSAVRVDSETAPCTLAQSSGGNKVTYKHVILEAVRDLGCASPYAIRQHIEERHGSLPFGSAFKRALEQGVSSRQLVRVRKSLKLAPKKKKKTTKTPKSQAPTRRLPTSAPTPRSVLAAAPAPASMHPRIAAAVVNPVSGLQSSGTVLHQGSEQYEAKLAYVEGTSNKFYNLQVVESHDKSVYWVVQHWGRTGTTGQHQVKEFACKKDAILALDTKFKSKTGVGFSERAQASGSGLSGKYHTVAEQRVAAAGGRLADDRTVCFCLAWDASGVDLDIHCRLPTGQECYYSNKNPGFGCSLDVDKQGHDYPNQVENIYLDASAAMDGVHTYFVRYFSGAVLSVGFTFTFNQFGKVIHEGTGTVTKISKDVPCVALLMQGGKPAKVDFADSVQAVEMAETT